MSRLEPKMFPDDPQKKGIEIIDSTDLSAINQSNGELNIDKLYPDTRPPVVQFENPYNINGGGFIKLYNFMSKPGKFQIQGKNLIDALKNGLSRLENQNKDIYNQKKKITVNLQRENNKRTNKLHKFIVKIFRVDHPIYHYKIELWKL